MNIEQERYPFEKSAKKLGRCDFSKYPDGGYKNERTAELFAMWLASKSACETFYSRNAELEAESAMLRAKLSSKSTDIHEPGSMGDAEGESATGNNGLLPDLTYSLDGIRVGSPAWHARSGWNSAVIHLADRLRTGNDNST